MCQLTKHNRVEYSLTEQLMWLQTLGLVFTKTESWSWLISGLDIFDLFSADSWSGLQSSTRARIENNSALTFWVNC